MEISIKSSNVRQERENLARQVRFRANLLADLHDRQTRNQRLAFPISCPPKRRHRRRLLLDDSLGRFEII